VMVAIGWCSGARVAFSWGVVAGGIFGGVGMEGRSAPVCRVEGAFIRKLIQNEPGAVAVGLPTCGYRVTGRFFE
jgi:hypothetical protein